MTSFPCHSKKWEAFDELARKEFWASLALRHCPLLGARSCAQLVDFFGSAYAAVEQLHVWKEAKISAEKAAQFASGVWRKTALEEWRNVANTDCHIVMWHDSEYPKLLKQLPDAPLFLYCVGDISLLHSPALAVVGSRRSSPEGLRAATSIARNIASCGISIVSGMALGVDAAAQRAALSEIGSSIGVLGTGIDVCYPVKNAHLFDAMRERGLLVTEFAPGTQPKPEHFPIRNRIISGLSLAVLVVEAAERSGSLITARLALEQNRDVYAVPGAIFSSQAKGCQDLVRQGARPVFGARDIFEEMAPQLLAYGIKEKDFPNISEEAIVAQDIISLEKLTAAEILPKRSSQKSVSQKSALSKRQTDISEKESVLKNDITQPPASCPEDCLELWHFLKEHGASHIDVICDALQVPVARISSRLIQMELLELTVHLSGARYALKEQ